MHCSAGIGRTGALITLDAILATIAKDLKVRKRWFFDKGTSQTNPSVCCLASDMSRKANKNAHRLI